MRHVLNIENIWFDRQQTHCSSGTSILLQYVGTVIALVVAGNEEDINCAEAAELLRLLLLLV